MGLAYFRSKAPIAWPRFHMLQIKILSYLGLCAQFSQQIYYIFLDNPIIEKYLSPISLMGGIFPQFPPPWKHMASSYVCLYPRPWKQMVTSFLPIPSPPSRQVLQHLLKLEWEWRVAMEGSKLWTVQESEVIQRLSKELSEREARECWESPRYSFSICSQGFQLLPLCRVQRLSRDCQGVISRF